MRQSLRGADHLATLIVPGENDGLVHLGWPRHFPAGFHAICHGSIAPSQPPRVTLTSEALRFEKTDADRVGICPRQCAKVKGGNRKRRVAPANFRMTEASGAKTDTETVLPLSAIFGAVRLTPVPSATDHSR